ncbi:hypothetical protein FHR99_001395 [Litorivivens lipolytica]|uniref:DUF2817 domain-containing protein n=1 Tax=Litorivivens lipolytica TaxID=1524264 RepID=A0A7W4W5A5_9GAMM|nr:DUF2817 domain-containing protein [Litorivivens lipolytica]MBB3047159.1 hypothetical protein [Litorivivens lipolytica]
MAALLPALDLSAFASDYRQARKTFLNRAENLRSLAGFDWIQHRHPQAGPDGTALHSDWLLLSQSPNPEQLLVLISGTHGVEGFVGSAVQSDILAEAASLLENPKLGILMIHALNPWGFAWLRRCDHEGIDLNRNFIDFKAGLPNNGAYASMHRLLSRADEGLNGFDNAALDGITRGQYQYPNGLYFGGHGPSWSREWLESRKQSSLFQKARHIAVIDLHTGLGPYGYGEVISDHPQNTAGFELARQWYGANAMSSALGESVSAPKIGLLDYFWHRLMGDRGSFVTLEFGTYAADEMLHVLIDEQRYHRQCRDGHINRDQNHPAVAALRDFFYPQDTNWQQSVLLRARQVITLALEGMANS